jgi:aminopeptidase N
VLNNDPCWWVRREASAALQEIHTDEAFTALQDSMDQSDARVRLAVVELIGGFYRPEVVPCMESVLANERNPEILIKAIQGMGRFQSPQTRQVIARYLPSSSYRNELAVAAIDAIRRLEDPVFIPDLMATLRDREREFQSWDFARGLGALARVARDQEDRTQVREFLAGYVNHLNRTIRGGALSALGTLGDPKAIPIVETFCGHEPHDRTQRQAKAALDRLREVKPFAPEEVIELRKTVNELKTELDKLRQEIEDMKKQDQAKMKAPSVAEDVQPDSSQDTADEQQ